MLVAMKGLADVEVVEEEVELTAVEREAKLAIVVWKAESDVGVEGLIAAEEAVVLVEEPRI